MTKILLIGQDKGGVGKSTLVRAIAEAIPDVPILEIDSSHRLIEFDKARKRGEPMQVTHFEMRANHDAIEKTGGRAARKEFDEVIKAFTAARKPTLVDVGANTCGNLFALLTKIAPDLKEDAGVEIGVLTVVTADPAAITAAIEMSASAKAWAAARFVVENRRDGAVAANELAEIAGSAPVAVLEEANMEPEAIEFLQARGLRDIPNLDRAQVNARYGISQGSRIRHDLTEFRAATMRAVEEAAIWLAGE